MKQLTFIASLMTMLAAPLFSQSDSSTVLRNPLDNLIVRSVVKQSIFPEERVYLHFDNNAYYLGETMWFKAYVTSGTDDTPTTMSRVLYVELVQSLVRFQQLQVLKSKQYLQKVMFQNIMLMNQLTVQCVVRDRE